MTEPIRLVPTGGFTPVTPHQPGTGGPTSAVSARGLGRRYGRRWALRHLAIDIPEGAIVGLVGPNGAGKSTLLHLIAGLIDPTEGAITVLGSRAGAPAVLPEVAFVAQDAPLPRRFTIGQLEAASEAMNVRWNGEVVADRCRRLDLDDRRRVDTLSGGQRAQLALALALAKQPRLLVLDEPVAALDPLARRTFLGSVMAAVAILAVVTGATMSGQYHSSGLADCLASRPRQDCGDLIDLFDARFASLQVLVIPLVLLPALVGAFLGAPLVAREIEAGTHRFLWTQALTPRQWLVTAGAHVLGLSLVAGVAYAAISARWLDLPNRVTGDRFGALYDLQGLVPVAATVFAVAAGITCGTLARRTVPAMAATVSLFVAARLAIALLLRPRLASPSTISFPFGSANPLDGTGAWQMSNKTVADGGLALGRDGSVDLTAVADRCSGIPTDPGRGLPDFDSIQRCVVDLDIRTVISYHPGDRFWTFQLIESGLLIALAAGLFVLAVSILRRRAA